MSDNKKLLVVIDPGHTGNTYNAGAVKGYYESKAVYDLSLYEKTALEKRGIDVILTRERNQDPGLYERGQMAVKNGRGYANELGYGDEAGFWEICGILHDIDFEEYPEEHCLVAPRLLKEGGAEDEVIHAVCSHGYGIHEWINAKPEHEIEKVLFVADELTGLIWAAAKMRPSKSTKDMEVSSLKKKFKDKKFAAGCSRDVIIKGAENLGWELPKLMEMTILAMRSCEDSVAEEMKEMGLAE